MRETLMRETPKGMAGRRDWQLVGGALCLDFVNTLDWRASDTPRELLTSEDAVRDWAGAVGLLPERDHRVRLSASDLGRLRRFREEIAQIIHASTEGAAITQELLDPLNRVLETATGRRRLVSVGHGIAWEASAVEAPAADRLVTRIAEDAAALLTGGRLDRVRQCAGRGCGWYFLDESRAGNRRWCSMATCGNRSKARAHYRRGRSRDE